MPKLPSFIILPSREEVNILVEGLVEFHPDAILPKDKIQPIDQIRQESSKTQMDKEEFDTLLKNYVLIFTNSSESDVSDVDYAVNIVKYWVREYQRIDKGEKPQEQTRTVPLNIKELEELSENAKNIRKTQDSYEKRILVKKLLIESEESKITSPIKKDFGDVVSSVSEVKKDKVVKRIPLSDEEKKSKIYFKKKDTVVRPLSASEKATLISLVEHAKTLSVEEFVNQYAPEIEKNANDTYPEISKDPNLQKLLKVNSKFSALYLHSQLTRENLYDSPQENPVWILHTLANPASATVKSLSANLEVQEEISRAAQTLAAIVHHDNELHKSLLSPLLGQELSDYLIGSSTPVDYVASKEFDPDRDYEITTGDLLEGFYDTMDNPFFNEIVNYSTENIYSYSQKVLNNIHAEAISTKVPPIFKALPLAGGYAGYRSAPYLANYIIGGNIKLLTPGIISSTFQLPANVGIAASPFLLSKPFNYFVPVLNLNINSATIALNAGQTARIFGLTTQSGTGIMVASLKGKVGGIGALVASKGVLKKTTSTLISKFLVTASTIWANPVIGLIVGWLGGELLAKLASKAKEFIVKHKDYFLAGFSVAMLSPLIFWGSLAAPAVLVFGTLATLGAAALAVNNIAIVKGIAARTAQVLLAPFSLVLLPSFLKAFSISLLIIPLTAIIFFIINTGAYLVPPQAGAIERGSVESPYIRVTKTANPPSADNNTSIEASYTVMVKAKKGTLSNIKFSYRCTIHAQSTKACPPISDIQAGGQPINNLEESTPSTISPVEDYLITYKQSFVSGQFNDSLIVDEFIVSADSEGVNSQATGIASLIIGNPPVPGLCIEGHGDITSSLAGQIDSGTVRLLPETIGARSPLSRKCIKPTMIVMHWSAGTNDNPDGNERTYETLVSRGLACQMATDTNDTYLMQPFYNTQVEMAWCAGEWNDYSINNEMAGVYFTDNSPPPNLTELSLALDATCKVMQRYSIPWCQIYGHFEVPNNGGKTDPGRDFLYNTYIPAIKQQCPNDPSNVCQ